MARLQLLLAILRPMGVAADRCQQLREAIERLGPVSYERPSVGAVIAAVVGIATIPAAILADYHLLSAPIDYICRLSGAASTHAARILLPVALAVVNLAASLQRSTETSSDNPFSEYEPRLQRLNPVITIVILLQLAAATAQYVALQAANPAPANALILLLLCGLAVVTHTAIYQLGGNGLRLLGRACSETVRAARRRRLANALRVQRRALYRHYQAWNAASHAYQQAHPGAPVPELDPVIVNEFNAAIGAPPATPKAPPATPVTPQTPSAPGEPVNPYPPVNPDDQRL